VAINDELGVIYTKQSGEIRAEASAIFLINECKE